jgi:hypothetical protein
MDPGGIRRASHQSIQGVNLAHQMALTDPANRRVAGHLPNRPNPMGQQQRARANPSGCRGRLASRMTAADNNDIVLVIHVWRSAIKGLLAAMANTTPFVARGASP